jgi:hypothetical protein
VEKGTVACATAATVERDYAAMIAGGRVRGNGGGAPVTVDGWTWECHTASAGVAAVLSSPTASSSPAPSGS